MTETWIQKHERLLIVLVLAGVLVFLGNKYLNSAADKADARNQAAQATLAAQKEANDKLAIQVQQDAAQYQVMLGQLNTQNAKLVTQIAVLSQSLAARQKQDATLTLPELALRHQALLGVSTGVSSTENGFVVSPPVETQTVQELESLPVIKQQLVDETSLADNKSKALDGSQALVVDLNKQVTGLQSQAVDSDKACKAQVDALKKDARKSKRNWFLRGAAVGGSVIAYVLLHI